MILEDRKKFYLSHALTHSLVPWLQKAEQIFGDMALHLHRSRRAAGSHGEHGDHEEFTVTSPLLVHLLLWIAEKRRRVQERRASRAALVGLLASCLSAEGVQQALQMMRHVPPACTESCVQDAATSMCCHAHFFLRDSCEMHGESPQEKLVRDLMRLASERSHCKALDAWFSYLLDRIGLLLGSGLASNNGTSDPRKDRFNSKDEDCLARPKRMRIDEDLKKLVVGTGGSSGGATLLRCLGDFDPSLAADWSEEMCSTYVSAMWLECGKARVIGLAPDGSRLGNPSEETVVYPAFAADIGYSAWLPPQAFPWNHQALHTCSCKLSER